MCLHDIQGIIDEIVYVLNISSFDAWVKGIMSVLLFSFVCIVYTGIFSVKDLSQDATNKNILCIYYYHTIENALVKESVNVLG